MEFFTEEVADPMRQLQETMKALGPTATIPTSLVQELRVCVEEIRTRLMSTGYRYVVFCSQFGGGRGIR